MEPYEFGLYHYGFYRTLALLYDMQLYTLHLQE